MRWADWGNYRENMANNFYTNFSLTILASHVNIAGFLLF
jgi:hypothetical protein